MTTKPLVKIEGIKIEEDGDSYNLSYNLADISMSKIKNIAEIDTYDESKHKTIKVKSHWNRRDFIEIEIGKEKVVIVGNDLIKAVNNCLNVGL